MNKVKGQSFLKLFNQYPVNGQSFYYSATGNHHLSKSVFNQLVTKLHHHEESINQLLLMINHDFRLKEDLIDSIMQNQRYLNEKMEQISIKIGAISNTLYSYTEKLELVQSRFHVVEQTLLRKIRQMDLGEIDYSDLKIELLEYKTNQRVLEEQLNGLIQKIRELESIQRNQEQVQLDLYSELQLQKL
ncbi:hypothetical protein [Bacillus sp. JCM 19034]|uniref:hypothetical protein n=1 Tax=Bacillus sp. JCM 19034 TaxID=1481928 RepID=UPI0007866889|nr:hypothetical protein [Bacillus sp. JCM 19034]